MITLDTKLVTLGSAWGRGRAGLLSLGEGLRGSLTTSLQLVGSQGGLGIGTMGLQLVGSHGTGQIGTQTMGSRGTGQTGMGAKVLHLVGFLRAYVVGLGAKWGLRGQEGAGWGHRGSRAGSACPLY